LQVAGGDRWLRSKTLLHTGVLSHHPCGIKRKLARI
jgi:hypothetical protein